MNTPNKLNNETERLFALKQTKLLDSPAEAHFDRITRLAVSIFGVKACFISLIDKDRVWFKSKQGIDTCQMARNTSFCTHTILYSDIFIVNDASKDKRFSLNPLVTEAPNFCFYAGISVHSASGHPIGTLCLIDPQPQTFSTHQKQMLRELADMVEHEIARHDQQNQQHPLPSEITRTASILSTLPDIVFVIDRDFRFLACNDHPDLLKPQHEILGSNILDILPYELGSQVVENVNQAFSKRTVIHHTYTFENLNKTFEARYKKINENEVLVVIRNITEQTNAHSVLRRLSEVARQTTNGVVITDTNGLVVWTNEAFAEISGYSLEEMSGKKPGELLQGPDTCANAIKKMREALASKTSFNVDVLNYSKEQKTYWIRIACNPMFNENGEHSGYIAIQTDVTKEKRDEEIIRNSQNLLKAVIDANTIGTWRLNLQDNQLIINDKWATLLGYELAELMPANRSTWERLTHPDDLAYCTEQIERYTNGLIPIYEANIRMKHKNGTWVWMNTRGKISSKTDDGKAEWLLGTHFDINDQIKAESSLNEKSRQMEAVVERLLDGIITINTKGIVLTLNQAAKQIFGYSDHEIVGKNISMLMDSPHRENHDSYLSNYINRGISDITGRIRELDALHKDGRNFPIELGVVEVQMDGETNFIGIVRDITQRKKREQEIHNLAFYDPLTLLPNRRLFLEKLQGAINHCLHVKKFAALMFLDLDNFKTLNDSAGHNIGDLLLRLVSGRLIKSVSQSDTVARLGGDEFVILVTNLNRDKQTAANQAESIAQRIMIHLAQEYELEGLTYNSSASIGVTMFKNGTVRKEDLLKQADMAMYKAKDAGRNRVQFFDPKMQIAVSARATLVNDLYCAIHYQQFILFYQIQVNHHGQIVGVEALLRWLHPQKGMISPAQFIPLTEETGLIVPIGDWVLDQACRTLALWAKDPATQNLTIAVNISVVQFNKDDFVHKVLNKLKHSGANPKRLKLEITESLLANNIKDVKAKMVDLQQHGITFSIDDFGTGYSSLSYLKQLPINQLKIDQGFVRDIIHSRNDKSIAQAVITLAKSMDLQVIAEGVETNEHRQLLHRMGCNFYQGYLFGKPRKLEELNLLNITNVTKP